MIHEVSGDILFTKAQAIAHGISPNDPFDQGLARALRERWPVMHKDYRHFAHQTHPRPGTLWEWRSFGVRIIHLLTQNGSFENGAKCERASLTHVEHCLKALKHRLTEDHITSLSIPRLATGVGGLGWEEVRPLIDKHLGDLRIPIYIYATYHPGEHAREPAQ